MCGLRGEEARTGKRGVLPLVGDLCRRGELDMLKLKSLRRGDEDMLAEWGEQSAGYLPSISYSFGGALNRMLSGSISGIFLGFRCRFLGEEVSCMA